MARISGIDLPREKRIEIALTYIFGIGLPTAQKLLARTGVDPNTRVKNLTEDDEKKLREAIDGQIKVEGDLRREIARSGAKRWSTGVGVRTDSRVVRATVRGGRVAVRKRFAAFRLPGVPSLIEVIRGRL